MESVDWSTEWLTSLLWILGVWVATVIVLGIVAVLIVRYTTWGRQFWRLAGPFVRPTRGDRASWRPTLFILVLLLLVVLSVRINLLLSYNTNELYTALQNLDAAAFWRAIGIFAVIAAVYVASSLVTYYVGQSFVIRLWEDLNGRLLGDWLGDRVYHRQRFSRTQVDNPDQRIQEDIASFAQTSYTLSIGPSGAVSALVTIPSFTIVLWQLSGPLSVFGLQIPRAMTFIAFLYVIVASVFAFRIGKPLIRLNFLNEGLGAFYRYGLVRVRDNAENIAFARGEPVERLTLERRFSDVIANYWRIVIRTLKFQGFNLGVTQISVVFPIIIQAPRFFARAISLGDIQQTAQAFGQVHDALSFFRNAYDQFAAYRAVLDRLTGLLDSDEEARELPLLDVTDRTGGVVVRDLTVNKPDGETLVSDLSLELDRAESLLVTGRSGTGKTTLLRSLADLWPYAEGHVERPVGSGAVFLAQQPYLPLGTLRTALAYPEPPEAVAVDDAARVLRAVALAHLVDRVDDDEVWWRVLSPGEQQRVGFARLLLARPDVVFLDEATAALDEGLEYELYTLLRRELPDLVLVSVGHRSSLEAFHSRRLDLEGDGRWRAEALQGQA
ncbi:ABC transporter ATP-binding protein/permease [Actinomycetospora sp. TBRC 11914]|uniref:ABC transporter ATP-binding protein/permease n=1 Tax=Actinomycetospora sp. TBRC 11914 TaxID=2729387 RepID=UPI00145D53A1|nr:ABC transporter ATP-binding protein/permease [Actinomycetospora sp. TBRC 11914]NMO90415.1 ABC transporter ATP-binding protein/permease [Actinomycetospora sp. TBRC 11914]